jgi:hypothetical protein
LAALTEISSTTEICVGVRSSQAHSRNNSWSSVESRNADLTSPPSRDVGKAVACHADAPRDRIVDRYVVEPAPHHEEGIGDDVLGECPIDPSNGVPMERFTNLANERGEALLTGTVQLGHDSHTPTCPA